MASKRYAVVEKDCVAWMLRKSVPERCNLCVERCIRKSTERDLYRMWKMCGRVSGGGNYIKHEGGMFK